MRNIRVSFGGVHAVDDVTIDLHPGEVVGLVGGNGAGKSTLMKVLSGAQRPTFGPDRAGPGGGRGAEADFVVDTRGG